jgi:hypothetical protein
MVVPVVQIGKMVVGMGQVLVGVNMDVQYFFVQAKVFMKMMTIGMVVEVDMLRFFVNMVMTMPGDI